MCKWTMPVLVVGLASAAFMVGHEFKSPHIALAAQPQDTGKAPQGKMPPEMEAMMKQMQPGPEHKVLDQMVGTWEGEVKMWMSPDQSPMTSKATCKREWVLDGRWLKEDITGEWAGKPFKGLGMTGYNTIEDNYESAWFENMATWMSTSKGKWDESKKTFTFSGECLDPMTQQKAKMRSVLDKSDPKKETMIGYSTGPDGKEFKSFEGTFTKK